MNPVQFQVEVSPNDVAEQARAVRLRLPGQAVQERVEIARAAYGPLYTLGLIRERVAETLPVRVGYIRSTVIEPIEEYGGAVPDEALVKYDDAARSGLFSEFCLVTPTYYRQPQVDPWIAARVAGTKLWAVIAQWGET